MKVIYFLLLMLLSFSSYANVTGIFEIWEPEPGEDYYLILATNRQVYEASTINKTLLKKLYWAKEHRSVVTLLFNRVTNPDSEQRETIEDLNFEPNTYWKDAETKAELTTSDGALDPAAILQNSLEEANITTLDSMATANRYFREMKVGTRARSQCYNRAHVWTFDWWKAHNLNSMKVWLFFTRNYIKKYRYKWWFHVSPATKVAGHYGIIAMDRKYMRGPTRLEEWKNFFVKSKQGCPVVQRYSDYYNNQHSSHCYYMITNMYFWQPFQIEQLEKGGLPATSWQQPQINVAYRDAIYTGRFWRRRRLVIPRVD